MLATFDGSSKDKPLYLAVSCQVVLFWSLAGSSITIATQIDGDVYDVSANRAMYGPGGSYHTMCVLRLRDWSTQY